MDLLEAGICKAISEHTAANVMISRGQMDPPEIKLLHARRTENGAKYLLNANVYSTTLLFALHYYYFIYLRLVIWVEQAGFLGTDHLRISRRLIILRLLITRLEKADTLLYWGPVKFRNWNFIKNYRLELSYYYCFKWK